MGAPPGGSIAASLPSLALATLLALSGCGLTAVEEARDEARTTARQAAAARATVPEQRYVTVRRVDRPYVGLEPVEEDRRGTLPERFLTQNAVTLPLAGAGDETVLASRIETATGLAVRFVGAAREGAGATFFAVPDGLSPNGNIWSGPLDRLLDSWTGAAGHDWRYDAEAGRIEIVRSLAAVFRVNALAGAERHGASSSTQDRAGDEGSGSLSAQSIETETVYDPWPEIEAQLAALVGEDTTVAVSPAGASVSDAALTLTAGAALTPARNVDGALLLPTGGICSRTAQVRDAIVTQVKEDDSAVTDCSMVTAAHLAAVTVLSLNPPDTGAAALTRLGPGDFAGLSAVWRIWLSENRLRDIPAGVFDPLTGLQELYLNGNDLATLPPGLFDRLTGLNLLDMENNDLAEGSLPDGIFEKLGNLSNLNLIRNPGTASFKPTANAGAGVRVSAGETVRLDGSGSRGGPWGTNFNYSWTETNSDGTETATAILKVTATSSARPTVRVPVLAEEAEVGMSLVVWGRGVDVSGPGNQFDEDLISVAIRGLGVTGLALVSKPIADSTYRAGEAIEVAVTFGDRVLVDTEGGTPSVALRVEGANATRASYVRGGGTRRLVFAYTVRSGDLDVGDGVAVGGNGLQLNGGTITSLHGAKALLAHDALAADADHKADGRTAALTGGVCDRTAQVRDALVALVKATHAAVTDCSLVTTPHLEALTGRLDLAGLGIKVLKRGDFAHLTGIKRLVLFNNELTALPAGVFEGLDDTLSSISLTDNDLETIPAGVFDRLTGLAT